MITLADIFEALTGARLAKPGLSFKEVTCHSMQVHANSLFVAVPGENKDGHTYVGDAFHRGARAAIVQRDMRNLYPVIDLREGVTLPGHPVIPKVPFCLWVDDTQAAMQKLARFWCARTNPTLVAIAGCQTDTVVTDLIETILTLRWPTIRHYHHPGEILDICQDLLHLDPSEECLLLEIHPDELQQMKPVLEMTQPQVGLVIRPPYLPSSAEPCRENDQGPALYELFSTLPRAPRGHAVLNYDRVEERQIAGQTLARPIFYGLNPLADLWADEIESLGQEGIQFHIHYRFEALVLRTPIVGRHSVHVALQAAAVGLALGLTWQEIATGLRMDGSGLRLLTARTPAGAVLIDDTYSNSADSALATLNLIDQFEGRKVAVLAEIMMTDPTNTEIEIVGTRAAEVCEIILAVGEKARPLIEGARRSRGAKHLLIWTPTPQEAIQQLAERIRPNDIVLIKGSQEVRMDSIVTALEGDPA